MSRRRVRCSSSSASSSSRRFSWKNRWRGVPVALDQRAADEQLARQRAGRSGRSWHVAPGDDRQAVQRHPLGGDDRPAARLPARLAVGARAPGGRRAARPTAGSILAAVASPQPRGLDQLGRHHPGRLLPRQRRSREDREARAARAQVLAPLRVLASRCATAARRAAPGGPRSARRGAVDLDARVLRRLAQLVDQVLPLAHAQVVQELGRQQLAELVAGQLALLLAEVAPQVQVGQEVRRLASAKRACAWSAACALLGRPLARVLDRQRGGDDDHLVGAAERGRPRAPCGPAAGRPAAARACARARSAAAPSRRAALDRAELVQQVEAVADLARGRAGRGTGSPRSRRGRAAAICRITDGEVRAQDLRVGEARARDEVVLVVEADADAAPRCARSGPCAGRPTPARSGSIGSRWTFSRAL